MDKKNRNVDTSNLHLYMWEVIDLADTLFMKHASRDSIVTSAGEGNPGDGVHANRSSHYFQNNKSTQCQALDFQTWDLGLKFQDLIDEFAEEVDLVKFSFEYRYGKFAKLLPERTEDEKEKKKQNAKLAEHLHVQMRRAKAKKKESLEFRRDIDGINDGVYNPPVRQLNRKIQRKVVESTKKIKAFLPGLSIKVWDNPKTIKIFNAATNLILRFVPGGKEAKTLKEAIWAKPKAKAKTWWIKVLGVIARIILDLFKRN